MSQPVSPVHLLSGGAAQGLVQALASEVAALGIAVQGSFGAVGAMQEKLLAGEPCDAFVSTAAMLQALAAQGRMDGSSIRALGSVATGIAVKSGRALPAVGDADSLRATLLAAAEVHCPDTVRSTAGIHFAKVLERLGVADALGPRLHMHPNGNAAMRAVAASAEPTALGCTQITEILFTPGVQYAGDLPDGFGLRTVYAAGVTGTGLSEHKARALVDLLGGEASRKARVQCGFVA